METSILLVDVGHTRIKVARCLGPGKVEGLSSFPADAERVLIASVSKEKEAEIPRNLLPKARFITPAEVPVSTDYDRDKIGVDRLLAVLSAVNLFPKVERIVVVDAGSLITVEFVEKGHHLGGMILPPTSVLREVCENVIGRRLDLIYPEMPWGLDTESAVGSGLKAMFLPVRDFSPDVLVLGGGISDSIKPILQALSVSNIYTYPHLPLLGLSFLADLLPED